MPLSDRPLVRRVLEGAESRLGVSLQPARAVERWQAIEQEYGEFRQEAEDLAWSTYDYMGGRPHELRPERRRRLAQRSRIALLQDPLAGAEAQLLGDFAFGKGVPKPSARDEKVQEVIDAAWMDAINQQILTSYLAQRRLSNELLNAAELFVTLYERGGRIRVGRRSADLVMNVVTDPENEQVPLWYVIRDRRYEWDFDRDAPKVTTQVGPNGLPSVKYWDHWQNVEIATQDRTTQPEGEDEQPLELPPDEKRAKGKVYHLAINQTGEQLRGNPPWARSLRFMSAMNVLTEAHVTMAQAASSFIARRAMRGSERQITKAAERVLSAAGELGSSALRPLEGWGSGTNAEPTSPPFTAPGAPAGFPPGSWWSENMDSSRLEPLSLQSGAGQMTQTAQIVRAPVAASSGFGQHYLGDATNANLATASTLELPATMHVGAWQEFFEGLYRWFTDRAIEAAVRAGRLGGAEGFADGKRLSDMRLWEAEDVGQMEKRTGKDLSYEFSMPFPGRRQLADVTTLVQQVSASQDPNGVNVPLRRILLRFLFEQMGIDDVAGAVEECIPEKGMPGGIGPPESTGTFPSPAGAGGDGAGTGARYGAAAGEPPPGQQPYGARSGTAAGGGSAGPDGSLEALEEDWTDALDADERAAVRQLEADTEALWRRIVVPQIVAAAGASNGAGG